MAILAVFIFHCLATVFGAKFLWAGWFRDASVAPRFLALLPLPAFIGNAGVPIFFVVSGFCIHMSFRKNPQWEDFFIRRFFRIYPPYLLSLLLFLLILPGFKGAFNGPHTTLQLLSHLFLFHNFNGDTIYGINPSYWSIAVEVQLYLLYPVLLMLVKRWGWQKSLSLLLAIQVLIAGVTGVASAMMIYPSLRGAALELNYYNWGLATSPLGYWFSWSIGAYVADAFLEGRAMTMANRSVVSWLGLAVLSYFIRPFEPFTFLLFSIATAVAISRLLAGQMFRARIPHACLTHLRETGVWSYSLYLLHQPLLILLNLFLLTSFPFAVHHPYLRFGFCLASWFAIRPIGALWFHLIERPAIAAGKKIVQIRLPAFNSD